jgi:hypothetical protein
MRRGVVVVVLVLAFAAGAEELQRANELAWARRFAEAEVAYRKILAAQLRSAEAALGLARVVMWQGRYREAITLFAKLDGIEAIEGLATAQYWSGDHRAAARNFRRVLAIDPGRDTASRSLAEIQATAVPSQRVTISGATDDQPLDMLRGEVSATLYSDVQTQWSAILGHYEMDAQPKDRSSTRGEYATLANETTIRAWTVSAAAGLFTFPDGVRQPVGSASLRRNHFTLRVERQPEIASAPSLVRHVASTTSALRWDWNRNWLASAEITHRSYSDHNQGRAASAYLLIPFRRHGWTLWSGGSVSMRDTDESRFTLAGRYDPYWTPDDLREARAVFAFERNVGRGTVKVHADAGHARDRGRAGDVPFDRTYDPWRAGISAGFQLGGGFHVEAAIDRSTTVDYRVTSFHVSLVRRR